jgi:hypothetical protein
VLPSQTATLCKRISAPLGNYSNPNWHSAFEAKKVWISLRRAFNWIIRGTAKDLVGYPQFPPSGYYSCLTPTSGSTPSTFFSPKKCVVEVE